MGARAAFLEAGGKEHRCIECPGGSHEWLASLADFSVLQIADWPTAAAAGSPEQLAASRAAVWRWVPCSKLDRVLLALVLIAVYAHSAKARGRLSIKNGLVEPCCGRQLAKEDWYIRLRVCCRLTSVIRMSNATVSFVPKAAIHSFQST